MSEKLRIEMIGNAACVFEGDRMVALFGYREHGKTRAERYVAAELALEIMQRRKWTIYRRSNGKWAIDVPTRAVFDGASFVLERPDPLAAIISAEEWYVANVGKGASRE